MKSKIPSFLLLLVAALGLIYPMSIAFGKSMVLPSVQLSLTNASGPDQMAAVLKVLLLLTVLSLAPSILIMTTSFVRMIIVFSFLRQAIGTQTLPPNQLIVALSLFLTAFVMAPVWKGIHHDAIAPYFQHQISEEKALGAIEGNLRTFMFSQTRDQDIGFFVKLTKMSVPKKRSDVPTYLLIPAFLISELKTAFQIGFMIYIPFLILDMVIASVLMSMGMMMVPPAMIALPFKLVLFVLVDGWQLVVGSLIKSFG